MANAVLLYLLISLCGYDVVSTSPQHWDTIVVGLGSAGTTAASTLARAGRRVLALEAQERVGGRVHTVPFGDGVVEVGGEWIQGTETSLVYEQAVQNNVTTLPQDFNFKFVRANLNDFNKTQVDDLMNYALKVSEEPPEKPEVLGEYITRRLKDYVKVKYPQLENQDLIEDVLSLVDLMLDTLHASNSWNELSTFSFSEDISGHQYMSWHRHGYKTFFELLLNTYKGGPGLTNLEIKLNTEVRNIKWPQEPAEDVVVTTADGTAYRSRNVIVTVSLGVLKERHATLFTPELPQQKQAAIDHISMGVIGKIIFSFDTNWWSSNKGDSFNFLWSKEDRRALGEDWSTKIVGATSPMGADNALTLWTAGNTTRLIETLPEEEVKRKGINVLKRFFGNDVVVPEPTGMLRSTWNSNPYTRGTYSFDSLSTPVYPGARDDLGSPLLDKSGVPRVLFSGEATERKHYGTVHGAAETGFREASRLLSFDLKNL